MLSSLKNAIHKGTSAVQAAYAKQVAEADKRADDRLARAKTKLEADRAKFALQKEKEQLRKDRADATLAIKKERAAMQRERSKMGVQGAVRRTAKSVTRSVKKSRKSGLIRDFERAGKAVFVAPPTTKRKPTAKRKTTRKTKGEWWED